MTEPSRLDKLRDYADAFRVTFRQIVTVEQMPNCLPLARAYMEAGVGDPAEAVAWYLSGYQPEDASRLAAAGATPDSAVRAELAAADAADGGHRLADLDAIGEQMDDAAALSAMDPDAPQVVYLHTDSEE